MIKIEKIMSTQSSTWLLLTLAFFVLEANADPETIPETEMIGYLEQYGYLPPELSYAESTRTKESVLEGICALQTFAGLNVTGIADEDTTRLIRTPRCGVKDRIVSVMNGRFKRFAITGQRWYKKTVTYRVIRYSTKLNPRSVDRIIARALALWREHVPLKFRPSSSSQADINIMFARRNHGDDSAFDGRGGTLAHAFAPAPGIGGDVHFDEDEDWTIGSDSGTDFFQTAVHEIGHALGLDHSSVQASIMYPYQRPSGFDVKLYSDDIAGIEALYETENGPADGEDLGTNGLNRGPRPYYYGPIWPDYGYDNVWTSDVPYKNW